MSNLVRVRTPDFDVSVTRDYAEGLGDSVEILETAAAADSRGRPLPVAFKGDRRITPKDSVTEPVTETISGVAATPREAKK